MCQSGYVLNRDKCVLRAECGCRDTQGALIPVSGCPRGLLRAAERVTEEQWCSECAGLSLNPHHPCKLARVTWVCNPGARPWSPERKIEEFPETCETVVDNIKELRGGRRGEHGNRGETETEMQTHSVSVHGEQ